MNYSKNFGNSTHSRLSLSNSNSNDLLSQTFRRNIQNGLRIYSIEEKSNGTLFGNGPRRFIHFRLAHTTLVEFHESKLPTAFGRRYPPPHTTDTISPSSRKPSAIPTPSILPQPAVSPLLFSPYLFPSLMRPASA